MKQAQPPALAAIRSGSDFARCLVPLLDAVGWRGDQIHLLEALPHFPNQMGLVELLNTMANLKFEGKPLTVDLQHMDARLLPCLFVPKGGGAAQVLVALGETAFFSFDGATGEYTQLSKDRATGVAYIFRTMKKGSQTLQQPQPDWFQRVLTRFTPIFIHAILVTIIISLLTIVPPLFVKVIFDTILLSRSQETLAYLAVGMFFFILADTGFRFLRVNLFRYVSVRLGHIMGIEVFRRLLFLPPSATETANLGSQVSRVKDFESIREFFAGPAAIALFELPFLFLLIIALAIIGGPVALVPLGTMVLFALFGMVMMPVIHRTNAVVAQAGSERQAFIVEMLASLRAIKHTGAIHLWNSRYRTLAAEAATATYDSARLTGAVNAVSYLLVMLGGLGTLVLSIERVMAGSMTTGDLVGTMFIVWRILAPIGSGFGVLTQIGRTEKSIGQINRLMSIALETKQEANVAVDKGLMGQVAFSGVSLRYAPEAPPALLGVEFAVAPGEVTVVVGHDGGGKTTVLKLVLGLYHPQAGRVIIDDTNVRQFDPLVLRRSVAYAPKRNYLFYGTIAQNIALANPAASEAAVLRAAEQAMVLDEILAMPNGLQTRIGDHNVNQLSVSFQKRLCLARVFLRNSQIVLLDEPEYGLSEPLQAQLLTRLGGMRGEHTLFIATHLPSFFSIADKALWLENGRVRAWGPADAVARLYSKR
ncbi:MAG: ATP-binding cassette domain-containing protein [Magnetococcales bacterium]|nr:ATP-binding cassette domain-containing protein [Magnetococcales bacterium]